MVIRLSVLFFVIVISGCDSFKPATEAQCETLYDYIIALSSGKGFNDSNNTPIQNDLINSFSTTGLDLIFNLTGQKEKIVRRCSTTLNQWEVLSCIETKNKEDWKNDCKFKIE
jgi:hypothetical protein